MKLLLLVVTAEFHCFVDFLLLLRKKRVMRKMKDKVSFRGEIVSFSNA